MRWRIVGGMQPGRIAGIMAGFGAGLRGEAAMKPQRTTSRRSFLARVVGGTVAVGGAIGLVDGLAAQNVRYSGVTDCDSGQGAASS